MIFYLLKSACALATEFVDETQQEFTMRTHGNLEVSNSFGDITVQGWGLDKIKIIAKKTVIAKDLVEAKIKFSELSHRLKNTENGVELHGEYGEVLSVDQRLSKKITPLDRISFTVFAPSKLNLTLLGRKGRFELKNWNANVLLRLSEGVAVLEDIRDGQITEVCKDCDLFGKNIHGDLKCKNEQGNIRIIGFKGSGLFIETESGNIETLDISGPQVLISHTGEIKSYKGQGSILFRTQSGRVTLGRVSSPVTGGTESGNVSVQFDDWNSEENSEIVSNQGLVRVQLPDHFASSVDFRSKKGQIESEIEVEMDTDNDQSILEGKKTAIGKIKESGSVLKLFSRDSDVIVIKEKF